MNTRFANRIFAIACKRLLRARAEKSRAIEMHYTKRRRLLDQEPFTCVPLPIPKKIVYNVKAFACVDPCLIDPFLYRDRDIEDPPQILAQGLIRILYSFSCNGRRPVPLHSPLYLLRRNRMSRMEAPPSEKIARLSRR